mgnify:CR=1
MGSFFYIGEFRQKGIRYPLHYEDEYYKEFVAVWQISMFSRNEEGRWKVKAAGKSMETSIHKTQEEAINTVWKIAKS